MTSGYATARSAVSPETMLLRPEEAARELRIARRRIFDLIRTGELESVQIGRSRRISRAALQQYVESLGGGDAPAA